MTPHSSVATRRGDIRDERMIELREEKDHRQTTLNNQKVLLQTKLESLRGLAKDIQEDEWMYETSPAISVNTTTSDSWAQNN